LVTDLKTETQYYKWRVLAEWGLVRGSFQVCGQAQRPQPTGGEAAKLGMRRDGYASCQKVEFKDASSNQIIVAFVILAIQKI
jgi:hypothetical protein